MSDVAGLPLDVYTPFMRGLGNSLCVLACIGLVTIQLSGVHMHVDADGYVGVLEASHAHSQAGYHDHHHNDSVDRESQHGDDKEHADYENTKDVSILDLSGSASKVVLAVLFLGSLLLYALLERGTATPVFVVLRLRGRHSRWRPPLRAPPHQL